MRKWSGNSILKLPGDVTVEINMAGPLRIVQIPGDGPYVTGQGNLIPVYTAEQGQEVIAGLREGRKYQGSNLPYLIKKHRRERSN
jgi:hypothetical protein